MRIKNLEINRNQIAVKSNDLIQRSRFSLTLQQQKIILFLISKIRQTDEEFKVYEFDIKKFCEICGIEETNYGNLTYLKDTIKRLSDKSLWIKLENGEETLLRWIEKPKISADRKTIKIKLDEDMKPYLLQLRERFTKIELISTLAMKSAHSIRLYEYFLSKKNMRVFKVSLAELREITDTKNKYERYIDWKKYVLDKSLDEIYKYSDIAPFYKPLKYGKKVYGFEIEIIENEMIDWQDNATARIDKVYALRREYRWKEKNITQ